MVIHVDPDQMVHSDLGLHCLPGCLNTFTILIFSLCLSLQAYITKNEKGAEVKGIRKYKKDNNT